MKRKLIILIAILPLLIVSCAKYDEGGVSLQSKTKRIIGEWEFVSKNETSDDLVDATGYVASVHYICEGTLPFYERYTTKSNLIWEFEEDKDMKEKFFGTIRNLSYGLTTSSPDDCDLIYITTDSTQMVNVNRWEFSTTKEELKIHIGNTIVEYEIIELSKKTLKIRSDLGDTYLFNKLD